MRRDVKDLRVIVTGASGGIGRALVLELAAHGAKVVAAARNEVALQELARTTIGVVPVRCDVAVPADRERLLAAAVAAFGGLDVLINNAGVAAWGHFATSTEAINRTTMEVNFFAPVELTRLAMPLLKQGRTPAVVNVTSMCGRRGMPAWPEYSASKFALVGVAEAWRAEFGRFDVDVITVVPGLTKSDLSRHLLRRDGRAELPYENGMTLEYVAAEIARAIRKNAREVVLGGEAKRMLLMNRFFPRLLNRLIARRITKLYATERETPN